jgi:23S rRNA (adenine2503-C2)-methyltransferase
METKNLIGLSREEFAAEIMSMGGKTFRANQLWEWVYNKGAKSFDDMTSISKQFREDLKLKYNLNRPTISTAQKSIDGTHKWLLKLHDDNEVEAVHIPEEGRGSLCISSQVGCSLNCTFCHTGTQRMVRNLTAEEILGQFMLSRDELNDWPSKKEIRLVSNIVMMGMGEPLMNYDNVAKALKIIMDGEGLALSKRRITLSTSGVVPLIEKCGHELGVNLAISLHAVTNELRNEIVPVNRKYPLETLLEACRNYPASGNTRRITFEYVMLKDVNDADEDAHAMVKLLEGIPAKVNLIPFNKWPGTIYERSSNNRIRAFSKIIEESGYSSPVRKPRGEDILAACGQLKSESIKIRKDTTA